MSSRRRSRQFALQALYQADLSGVAVAGAFSALWTGILDGEGLDPETRAPDSDEVEFAQRLAFGVEQHRERIDTIIEDCSTNWRVPRMPVVDRNILRMAGYELIECTDIPATVSINEAVELAKRFGTADSKAFVNGIVDRMARQLNRIAGDSPTRRRTTAAN